MTAAEYKAAIAQLGLSQVAAARLMGVDPRTSRRWAGGERDIPELAARFLKFLIVSGISGEEAAAVLDDDDEG